MNRCEITDLLEDQCAHCLGHQGDDGTRELGPWFTAVYPGRCGDCDEPIHAGDCIRADGHSGYLCCGCGAA